MFSTPWLLSEEPSLNDASVQYEPLFSPNLNQQLSIIYKYTGINIKQSYSR